MRRSAPRDAAPAPAAEAQTKGLLSLDTDRTDLSNIQGPGLQKGGDYPQAWTRDFGTGRVFYTTLGHRADIGARAIGRHQPPEGRALQEGAA